MSAIDAHFKGTFGAFSLDAAFSCPSSGVTGLFGPSGSGKTTVLRCLAGLARGGASRLRVDGEVWQDDATFIPPHRRSIGYVFQEARLFAHLSVLDNLKFGLRRSRDVPAFITLGDVVDLLAVGPLLTRRPMTLSGGERQRVAIGRALLTQPRLLLMDEPLSALDRDAKHEIFPYLETVAGALARPIIYVSHDLSEIERLASDLIVMARSGQVRACGPVAALLTDLDLPLARLPDAAAVLTVTVEAYDNDYDLSACRVGAVPFLVPGCVGPIGRARRLRVKASDVSLVKVPPPETSVLNIVPARVVSHDAVGAGQVLVVLALEDGGDDARLLSSITRKSFDTLQLSAGTRIFAQVKGMAVTEPDGLRRMPPG